MLILLCVGVIVSIATTYDYSRSEVVRRTSESGGQDKPHMNDAIPCPESALSTTHCPLTVAAPDESVSTATPSSDRDELAMLLAVYNLGLFTEDKSIWDLYEGPFGLDEHDRHELSPLRSSLFERLG